jgi:dipeptidyl-peptidase-4
MDESMVTDYPLVNIDERIAQADPVKYPMAGMKSHEVTVGVFSMETTNTVWLKTGEPKEQYLTNIAWSPDEQSIYIAVINREQNHMWFNQYSAITGEFIKTLFEEKHEKYVEPQNPMVFLKSKSDHFLWQSQRDGYNHVYLYKTDGTLVKQVTKGEGMVTEIIGIDAREQFMYFMSTKQSPLESHLYRVDLKTGDERRLTLAAGTHRVLLNTEAGFFIDIWSSTTVPSRVELYQQNGKFVKQLLAAKNPYNDYSMGSLDMVTLTANDGKTSLYGRVIKPTDFDSTKKYPVIVYVYGGPHTQLVKNSWLGGARLWEYFMAQKGYVMFTIDNRGSSNRSLEFENAIHRNIGVNELADQLTGIEYLKGLSYVDTARIGVHGWSYGGFMTVSMMLKVSKIFKVGVAGGPVIDWSLYEVMYGERYMDTPEENPEGYSNSNLKNYVKNLKGKLLIIHGDIDATVVPQHSFGFLHECVKQGVQVDFFMYPRHEHNVRGRDRVHLMQKVTNYFDDYL